VGRTKKSRERPYKISMLAFLRPIVRRAKNDIVEWFGDMILIIKARVFKFWFCDHCEKYHGPRTVQYYHIGSTVVCSIGKNELILKTKYRESDFNAYVGRTRL